MTLRVKVLLLAGLVITLPAFAPRQSRAESVQVLFHMADGAVIPARLLLFSDGYFIVDWKNKRLKIPEHLVKSIVFHREKSPPRGQRQNIPAERPVEGRAARLGPPINARPRRPGRQRLPAKAPFVPNLNTPRGRRAAKFLQTWEKTFAKIAQDGDLSDIQDRGEALKAVIQDDPRIGGFIEARLRRHVDILRKRPDAPAPVVARSQLLLAIVLTWEGDMKDAKWIAEDAKERAPDDPSSQALYDFARKQFKEASAAAHRPAQGPKPQTGFFPERGPRH